MKILSACFSGHRANKMPYSEIGKEYEKLENIIKEEITKLIREGVSEFFAGGQNGCDEVCSLIVMHLKEELGTTANLNLVLPYSGMDKGFTDIQKDNFKWIKQKAKTIKVLHEKHTKNCYRKRNQYLVDNSDFLIAIRMKNALHSGTQMTINLAKKKGIEVRIINPITYEVEVIKAKKPVNIFDK